MTKFLTIMGQKIDGLVHASSNNKDAIEIQSLLDRLCDDWHKGGVSIEDGSAVLIRMLASNIAILTRDGGREALEALAKDFVSTIATYAIFAHKIIEKD